MSALGVGVDDRWTGDFGIGRYSREVLPRLDVNWHPLGLTGTPHSPLEMLRQRPNRRLSDFTYSPGFNALLTPLPQVITVHDLIHLDPVTPGRARYAPYYSLFVRPAIRKAGVVITVSETSREAIEAWLDDDSVRVVNAGNGVSDAFHAHGDSTTRERPYLLCVSNLSAHKNVSTLLAAMRHLEGADLVLVVSDREGAARAVAEAGVADRVVVVSGLSDPELARYYRGAAATVMPSLVEGFGLPSAESLACGTPVIYWAGCAAVAEIVGERGTAVADATDPRAWAAAAEALLEAPITVALHPDEFSWNRTSAQVSDILRTYPTPSGKPADA